MVDYAPKNNYTPKVLDIRDWEQPTKEAYFTEIKEAVKETQKIILRPHYNVIHMTRAQYKLLGDHMQNMYESDKPFFYTPMNVMEVMIDESNEQQ